MKKSTFLLLCAMAFPVVACGRKPASGTNTSSFGVSTHKACPKGNEATGSVRPKKYTVAPFSRIVNQGTIDVLVVAGQPTQEIVVEAQESLLPQIIPTIADGKLVISTQGDFCTHEKALVTIRVPQITSIINRSAGDIHGEGLDVPGQLEVVLSGSGDMHLTGKAQSLSFSSTGSGDADLRKLVVKKATAMASSSGDTHLCVFEEATGRFTGSGNTELTCGPTTLSVVQTGSGDLTVRGLEKSRVFLEISGFGDATLEGGLAVLEATLDGMGDLNAHLLPGSLAHLQISGGGNITLNGTVRTFEMSNQGIGSIHTANLVVDKTSAPLFTPADEASLKK